MAEDYVDRVFVGSCEDMAAIPDGVAQTCVTSPPYWGLRDYGAEDQLGPEVDPEDYIARLVAIMGEVRRVLRDDGTLWLNLGDTYYGESRVPASPDELHHGEWRGEDGRASSKKRRSAAAAWGLKRKDLMGMPWRVALALQADGWWLRSDIIWSKPNPMPSSVKDRPTSSHEYLFLLSKRRRYYYDAAAIAEASVEGKPWPGIGKATVDQRIHRNHPDQDGPLEVHGTRNRRTVWSIATRGYPGAHFATFPPELVEPCVKAGSREGDLVLDPFMGSGTVALVAKSLARNYVGYEINPDYLELQEDRLERYRGQQTLGEFHG